MQKKCSTQKFVFREFLFLKKLSSWEYNEVFNTEFCQFAHAQKQKKGNRVTKTIENIALLLVFSNLTKSINF